MLLLAVQIQLLLDVVSHCDVPENGVESVWYGITRFLYLVPKHPVQNSGAEGTDLDSTDRFLSINMNRCLLSSPPPSAGPEALSGQSVGREGIDRVS